MSARRHLRAAHEHLSADIDVALNGRRHLAAELKERLAQELDAIGDHEDGVADFHRDREAALREALAATQKERDDARADVQRLGRGLLGLQLDEDGRMPVVWN